MRERRRAGKTLHIFQQPFSFFPLYGFSFCIHSVVALDSVLYFKATTIRGNYVPYSSVSNSEKSDLRHPTAIATSCAHASIHIHTFSHATNEIRLVEDRESYDELYSELKKYRASSFVMATYRIRRMGGEKKIISDIVQSALNNIPSINEDIEIKYEQICIMQISFEIIRRDRSFNTSGQKK